MKTILNSPHWIVAARMMLTVMLVVPMAISAQTWTTLKGPPQARNENDIAASADGSTLYVCDQSVLFKSTNSGSSWASTTVELSSPLVATCKWDNASTVVAGVYDYIYRSTNGGSSGSWASVLNESGLNPLRLSVSPVNSSPVTSDDMYLGLDYLSSPSLRRSTNGGSTWINPTDFSFTTSVTDIAAYPVSGSRSQHVWAAGLDPDYADHLESEEHSNPPVVTASAVYCGLWQSTDRGDHWTQKGMGDFNITALAIADVSPSPPFIYAASGTKLYRSDEGSNWAELTAYHSSVNAVASVIRIGASNNVFAGTSNGVWKSTNSGGAWTNIMSGIASADKDIKMLTIAHDNTSIMYASTTTTVWKTTDAGSNWSKVESNLGRMPVSSVVTLKNQSNIWSVSENFSLAGKYASSSWTNYGFGSSDAFLGKQIVRHQITGDLWATGSVGGVATLFRSTDQGGTFPTSLRYQPSSNTSTTFYGTAIDSNNTNYVYLFGYAKTSGGTVRNWIRSTNGGSTWDETLTAIGSSTSTVQDLVVDPTGVSPTNPSQRLFAAVKDGGIQRSTNGGIGWSQVFPVSTRDVRSIAINALQPGIIYAATSSGLYRSTNSGDEWTSMYGGAFKKVIVNANVSYSNKYVWIISDQGYVTYTPDGGYTWFPGSGNLPIPVYDLRADTAGNVIAATDQGVWKFSILSNPSLSAPPNQSSPTVAMNTALTWGSVTGASAYHLMIDDASNFGSPVIDAGSVTSTTYTNPALTNSTTYYWKVAASNIAGESAFPSAYEYKFGATQNISLTVTTVTISSVKHPKLTWSNGDPGCGNLTYYVYRNSCPYGEGDCGVEPYPLIAVTTNTSDTDLVIPIYNGKDPTTTYYYQVRACNYSNRATISSSDPSQTSIKSGFEEGLPRETKLEASYPNPFNPTTEIKYSLKENTHVLLQVYDILGREVRTLADEFQTAGYKSIEFNASNLPSGVYFYRLTAGSNTDVKKMLLAR